MQICTMISALCDYLVAHTPVSPDEAIQITEGLEAHAFKKGDNLQLEGKLYGQMYFVAKGLLKSYTMDNGCREHILQFAPENWWAGDLNSMYFNEPSLFYIEAVEYSEVVCVNKEFYARARSICPAFSDFHEHLLFNSIRHMQKRINLLLAATAEERYLDFTKLYPDVTLRVPQLMIASYLGITPESLSRVRKELAKKPQ